MEDTSSKALEASRSMRRPSESTSSSGSSSSRMEIGDFYGILIMWAAATGIVITMRAMETLLSWPCRGWRVEPDVFGVRARLVAALGLGLVTARVAIRAQVVYSPTLESLWRLLWRLQLSQGVARASEGCEGCLGQIDEKDGARQG